MKKVSIITILDNTNFGTYLQVVALGQVLKEKGCEVEVVKYIRKHTRILYKIRKAFSRFSPKTLYTLFVRIPVMAFLRWKDYQFVSKYLLLSKTYTSFEELKRKPPEAGLYLTGSDQVWNSIYNNGIDRAYYLDYAPIRAKRCAYAASIGQGQIPKEEAAEIKGLLSNYALISVREKNAVDLLKELGVDSELVLDPTLLLPGKKWVELVDCSCFNKTEPYLLVYSVETTKENKVIETVAKRIAQEKQLKIYGIYYGGIESKLACCDRNFYYATPDKFISLFSQADFVVVSSFHGTAFSINFNKNFITVSPARFNSRIDSLLELSNLKDKCIATYEELFEQYYNYDYSTVNQILTLEREKSNLYIDKMLRVSFNSCE